MKEMWKKLKLKEFLYNSRRNYCLKKDFKKIQGKSIFIGQFPVHNIDNYHETHTIDFQFTSF